MSNSEHKLATCESKTEACLCVQYMVTDGVAIGKWSVIGLFFFSVWSFCVCGWIAWSVRWLEQGRGHRTCLLNGLLPFSLSSASQKHMRVSCGHSAGGLFQLASRSRTRPSCAAWQNFDGRCSVVSNDRCAIAGAAQLVSRHLALELWRHPERASCCGFFIRWRRRRWLDGRFLQWNNVGWIESPG